MRKYVFAVAFLFSVAFAFAQNSSVKPDKYPSLLWQITGKGLTKPSYLFGTMHVSSKMAFHLSDSFYLGIRNADVVALETNPETWQNDMSKYDFEGDALARNSWGNFSSQPGDLLSIHTLQFSKYDELLEQAMFSNPAIINNLLYRTANENGSDFEEDTYLDMYIFQAGKKWGKKVCGVENFDESMRLMMEAYADDMKDENKRERTTDYNEEFSSNKLQAAYRAGNLDLLDTINIINSTSAAFDEKFLYRRNQNQAHSIDSILRTNAALFVGVGAAHLPGRRGVIELLRKAGYTLRPIKMVERDSRFKDEVDKINVPVVFQKRSSEDGFFSIEIPGDFHKNKTAADGVMQEQFADMSNGSYYMVTRVTTNASLWGASVQEVQNRIDSVMYENIPGKIISKKSITRNGYNGFDIVNKTRRGDYQRYNIFVTPFEVLFFKMSGNGDYVKDAPEADRFFNSIQLKNNAQEWKKYTPSYGGFEAQLPQSPFISADKGMTYEAVDSKSGTAFAIIRTDMHNYGFVEEDSFTLNLMEESFASSDFIDKAVSRKLTNLHGYPALDVTYRDKDGSITQVKYVVQGPHYYTLIGHGKKQNEEMSRFFNSFNLLPYQYGATVAQVDTTLHFSVKSPVLLIKKPENELPFDPSSIYKNALKEADQAERGTYKDKVLAADSTGEKIYISFFKAPKYYYEQDSAKVEEFGAGNELNEWIVRSKKKYTLPNKTAVWEYTVSDTGSSQAMWTKIFYRDGIGYALTTELDTLSQKSSFVTSVFESFTPADTVQGFNPFTKKTTLFFADFFGSDTVLHQRAINSIGTVKFDSTDLNNLKKSIALLTWKEKKYFDTKKDFIEAVGTLHSIAATDYLKNLYAAAGDTMELQHAILESMLSQKTTYAFATFKNIVLNDPPILSVSSDAGDVVVSRYSYDEDDELGGGSFMSKLSDSLQLSAGIIKDLMPLINIDDYRLPVMHLMSQMVDSGLLQAKDYEMYLPKFLLEAKQAWKKQSVAEKNAAIEKAQTKETRSYDYSMQREDEGNSTLSLYAKLLAPFWSSNASVPVFLQNILASNDRRLKYNTAYLLMKNKKALPDTMLQYFASLDDFRYELYTDLKELDAVKTFPAKWNNAAALGKSNLLQSRAYNKPDTIQFIEKLPVVYHQQKREIYFYKYKDKKEDNTWKLAAVGLLQPSKDFELPKAASRFEEADDDITALTNIKLTTEMPVQDQLQKAAKLLLNAKHKSAKFFYEEEDRGWNNRGDY